MKKNKQQIKHLSLEQEILQSNTLSFEEVEKIVENPQLLQNVRYKIRTKEVVREDESTLVGLSLRRQGIRKLSLDYSNQISAIFPKLFVVGGLSLTLALVIVTSQFLFRFDVQKDFSGATQPQIAARTNEKVESFDNLNLAKKKESGPIIQITNSFSGDPRLRPGSGIKSPNKNPKNATVTSIANPKRIEGGGKGLDLPTRSNETKGAFIPLTFFGKSNVNKTGQIVRVVLSPNELIKLGLLGYSTPQHRQVEAEMLLGEDGMFQAIRLVKKQNKSINK